NQAPFKLTLVIHQSTSCEGRHRTGGMFKVSAGKGHLGHRERPMLAKLVGPSRCQSRRTAGSRVYRGVAAQYFTSTSGYFEVQHFTPWDTVHAGIQSYARSTRCSTSDS